MSRLSHRTGSGYTYFVTTKTWQNRSLFSVPVVAQIVMETIIHYRTERAYLLHAFVVMPDHIHLLFTPGHTVSLEKAMQYIKGGFSHRVHAERGYKMSIWQPGFYDWTVRDREDFLNKVSYIRQNPVRTGLAGKPELWPYGSASGKFAMDETPRQLNLASGAEAPEDAGG